MKRIYTFLALISLALSAVAANSGWYLYVWSDASNSGSDVGQFVTTGNSGVYLLENYSITEQGLKYCIHNASWSAMYGWSAGNEGVVTSTGVDVQLGSTTSASGWLSLSNGAYDVTFNENDLTIRFDVHKAGPSSNKKVSILGDSYSTFEGYLTPSTNAYWYTNGPNAWHDTDVTSVEQTWWWQFINNNEGYELEVNNSYSGSAMCNTGYDGMDESTSFISRMINLGNPDIIFVFGATNDNYTGCQMGNYIYSGWTDNDLKDFRPGVAYILDYLKNHHPDAEIYFILNDMLEDDINTSVVTICDHYNVPVIAPTGIEKSDGHPNATGMTTIANAVKSVVIDGAGDEGNEWYITGPFNNWAYSHQFTQSSSDYNTFVLEDFSITSSDLDDYNGFIFNIVSTGWQTSYSYNSTIYELGSYAMISTASDGAWANAYCTALTPGVSYKLTWNKITHRLKIEESGSSESGNLVYLDGDVIKWVSDGSEVRLFGANYCLPSACDYRAAGYLGADRKSMIDEDMDHFKRMNFDALRLAFYGDYENTSTTGSLQENDHLDLLCYLIKQATDRGIYMLLTPIVTYDSRWPENEYSSNIDPNGTGMARSYDKWQLMFASETPHTYACNYIKELLNYTNPYTGNQIKNEPNILFIEMINEPAYASDFLTYQSSYTATYREAMNSLVEAVKSTGCQKPTFMNVSQNMHVSSTVNSSNIDGGSYAWYPFGLNNRRTVENNGLLWVDRLEKLMDKTTYPFNKARVVYEFDATDKCDGYTLPAMVREFRRAGVQFAAIYDYDMLRTAPYNNSNRTHYTNMVYTPNKAVSAMIAGEVMRQVAAGSNNTYYPANNTFGDFVLDHDNNLSMLDDGTRYYYSNTTTVSPTNSATIGHIAGCGSSPVVSYDGTGIYFLDKTGDDTWSLEVYPDITEVSDPFYGFGSLTDITSPSVVHKSAYNTRSMSINLPSLHGSFSLEPGKYTITGGSITASEELAAKDFYKSFEGITEPTVIPVSNTETNITLTRANADRWNRCYYSRTFHSPTSTLSIDWDNATQRSYYNYTVNSLTDNQDYTNYGYYPDATLSIYVGDRMPENYTAETFTINAKYTTNQTSTVLFLVVDNDGNAWGKPITLTGEYQDITVDVDDLVPYKAAMLPQDWPGLNSYWYPQSEGNTATSASIDWSKVDHVQLSMRKDLYQNNTLNRERGFSLDYIKMDGSFQATVLLGDVNGDGFLSIADVSVLIDYLLSGETSGSFNAVNADVNQSGDISIADVSTLIDMLLSN